MAVSKFLSRDWLLGWLVPADVGTAAVQAVALTDTAGVPVGSGAPLNVTISNAGGAGTPVTQSAVVSAENSRTAVLGANAVFTGQWVNVLGYGSIIVNVIANQASASDGLSIQQSSDGVNADDLDVFTVATSTAGKFVIPRQGAFARVVYTNGAVAQTAFRLQTILSPQMPIASAFRPADGMTNENDFPGVLSMGMVWNGATWDRMRAGPYQPSQVALIAGSGNVANATAAATLTGTATTTVYLAGFEITGAGSTTGLPVTVTATGLLGGTRSWTYSFAAGALVANTPLIVLFNPPLPASAVNTAIVVSCPAGGTGNTNNTTVAHGFYL